MRLLLLVLASVLAAPAIAAPALPQSHTDLTEPVSWECFDNLTVPEVLTLVNQGYRLVDLNHARAFSLVDTYSGVAVRNQGSYGKAWWWYVGITATQVDQFLAQNNARLIDIEPKFTSTGMRYAAIMIANTGADRADQHGWHTNFTAAGVSSWVANNPGRRIIDIQAYDVGQAERFSFVWVSNTGNLSSPWWIYLNRTRTEVAFGLFLNLARTVSISHGYASDRMTAIMVPEDGQFSRWFTGLGLRDAQIIAEQYGARVIDFEPYYASNGGPFFSVVTRENGGAFKRSVIDSMRSYLQDDERSGFLSRPLFLSSVLPPGYALSLSDFEHEPADALALARHYTVLDAVNLGADTLDGTILEFPGGPDRCDSVNFSSPSVPRTLRELVVRLMRERIRVADATLELHYPPSAVESTIAGLGPQISMNHRPTCYSGPQYNSASLNDFVSIFGAVDSGAIGAQDVEFYAAMNRDTDFGSGAYNTASVLADELQSSSLSSAERAAFASYVNVAQARGDSIQAGPVNGTTRAFRCTVARVQIPTRQGCQINLATDIFGAFVHGARSEQDAANAVGEGLAVLFRERVRRAIDTWESASCVPFIEYCEAAPNSAGLIASIGATGSEFAAANDLTLSVRSLPPLTFAMLLAAQQSGFVMNPGGSEGNLCLGGTIGRYVNDIEAANFSGEVDLPLDLTSIPFASTTLSASAGDTLFFQWWYRDVDTGGGPSSNFSRGLEVRFY